MLRHKIQYFLDRLNQHLYHTAVEGPWKVFLRQVSKSTSFNMLFSVSKGDLFLLLIPFLSSIDCEDVFSLFLGYLARPSE